MKQNTTKVGADGKSLQVGQCTAGTRMRINWDSLEDYFKSNGRATRCMGDEEKLTGVEVDPYGLTITIEDK